MDPERRVRRPSCARPGATASLGRRCIVLLRGGVSSRLASAWSIGSDGRPRDGVTELADHRLESRSLRHNVRMARFLRGASFGLVAPFFFSGLAVLLAFELGAGSAGSWVRWLIPASPVLMATGVLAAVIIRCRAIFTAGYSIDSRRVLFSDGGEVMEIRLSEISQVDWVKIGGMPPHARLVLHDGTDVFVPALDSQGSERLRHDMQRSRS